MIWHIFRKDWRLLRWYVAGLALLNLLSHRLVSQPSPRFDAATLGAFSLMAVALLIVVIAQQDPLPGVRQDWLVRPIPRRDLLLSKIAFVVLLVQAPIFLIEVGQGIAAGIPFGQVLGPTLSRSLWMLFALDLPVLAFASLTRNLMEAVVVGLVLFLGFLFSGVLSVRPGVEAARGTAYGWVTDLAQLACAFAGAGAILAIQYFRRKTIPARWISGGVFALWGLIALLPWRTAFAVQQQLSPNPHAADVIEVGFDDSPPPSFHARVSRSGLRSMWVLGVPLRVAGIPPGEMVFSEQVTARFKESNGNVVDLGRLRGGAIFAGAGQPIPIHTDVYGKYRDQRVTLEIELALTLMKPKSSGSLPALNGQGLVNGVGLCSTKTDERGWVELHCVTAGAPPCAIRYISNPLTGRNNGHGNECFPADYSPWFGHLSGGSLDRSQYDIHFDDGTRPKQFPIDRAQLKDSQVVIQTFEPEAYFTRRISIPDYRPADWAWQ